MRVLFRSNFENSVLSRNNFLLSIFLELKSDSLKILFRLVEAKWNDNNKKVWKFSRTFSALMPVSNDLHSSFSSHAKSCWDTLSCFHLIWNQIYLPNRGIFSADWIRKVLFLLLILSKCVKIFFYIRFVVMLVFQVGSGSVWHWKLETIYEWTVCVPTTNSELR